MYAKLVLSSNAQIALMMRDIVRLCTSQSPNVANLQAFSQTSSVIIDTTPAGWSYVLGAEANVTTSAPVTVRFNAANSPTGPAIGTSVNTANVIEQHTMSAPCLAPLDGVLKYSVLTSYANCAISNTPAGHAYFYLTGSANVNTSTGVQTGESYRPFTSGTGTPNDIKFTPISGNTYHLIATARHITLICATRGVAAVWETSQSEADVFYNAPPAVSYFYANNASAGGFTGDISTTPTASSTGDTGGAQVFNHTIPSTGVNAATRAISCINPFMFIHQTGADTAYAAGTNPGGVRLTGINTTGLTRHFATPLLFQSFDIGIPIKFITGVVPIYMLKGGTATTGDTVTINGVDYTYFDVISTAAAYCQPLAFAMLTY